MINGHLSPRVADRGDDFQIWRMIACLVSCCGQPTIGGLQFRQLLIVKRQHGYEILHGASNLRGILRNLKT
jgi:hypothetical protein